MKRFTSIGLLGLSTLSFAFMGMACENFTVCEKTRTCKDDPAASGGRDGLGGQGGATASGASSSSGSAKGTGGSGAGGGTNGSGGSVPSVDCPAGQYPLDSVCTDCASGEFSAANSNACSAWSDCAAGTFVSVAGTSTSDRECSACSSGFTAKANQLSCTAWSPACGAGFVESAAPTAKSDRVCSLHEFTVQFGTSGMDYAIGVATKGTKAIVAGYTSGTVSPFINKGGNDAFIYELDVDGTKTNYDQFGSSGDETVEEVAYGSDGSVWVVGNTMGALGTVVAPDVASNNDAFVRRYAPGLGSSWTRQAGATASSLESFRDVLVLADGSALVVGRTTDKMGAAAFGNSDVVVRKYDSTGTVVWSYQEGSTGADEGDGVGTDAAGNIFVFGKRGTSAGFITKLNSAGAYQWRVDVNQITSVGAGVVDQSNGDLYFAAEYSSASSVLLYKYDKFGTFVWKKSFTSTSSRNVYDLAQRANGDLVVAGSTNGLITGQSAKGNYDAFYAVYSTAGTQVDLLQFGTTSADELAGVAVDSQGAVWFAGRGGNPFPGAAVAVGDALVMRKAL